LSEPLPASAPSHLPPRAGVGLKAEHYRTILATRPDIGFFEVHAENYMGAGGPPHRYLRAIRDAYPLSLHGVGLSIGADQPLDHDHLWRLKQLADRYEPALISEHLAWSSHGAGFLNDLLPLPYTGRTLGRVTEHIDEIQQILGRRILLENPSTYLAFAESTYTEIEFISEIVMRTGCSLLLDVNNVYVSSTNQHWDPFHYIDAYPHAAVEQIHLAGHAAETDEIGRPLLIDTHDRPVQGIVWELFARAFHWIGPVPTLLEWDMNVPSWPALKMEVDRVEKAIERLAGQANAANRRSLPELVAQDNR
jgi:uncharacterized protein